MNPKLESGRRILPIEKESVLYCVVRLALHLFWEPQQTPLHPWRLVWAAKWRLIKSQDCHQHQSESSSVLGNRGDPPPQMAPRQVCPEKWCHCMSDLSLMHESTVDIRLTARDNVFNEIRKQLMLLDGSWLAPKKYLCCQTIPSPICILTQLSLFIASTYHS